MPNKATRILDSIKNTAGVEVHDNIIKACGILERKPTPKEVAGYVKTMKLKPGSFKQFLREQINVSLNREKT